ncbi:MAG: hypothetical protein ACXIUL_05990 [Wenzhouxiangella sp.]
MARRLDHEKLVRHDKARKRVDPATIDELEARNRKKVIAGILALSFGKEETDSGRRELLREIETRRNALIPKKRKKKRSPAKIIASLDLRHIDPFSLNLRPPIKALSKTLIGQAGKRRLKCDICSICHKPYSVFHLEKHLEDVHGIKNPLRRLAVICDLLRCQYGKQKAPTTAEILRAKIQRAGNGLLITCPLCPNNCHLFNAGTLFDHLAKTHRYTIPSQQALAAIKIIQFHKAFSIKPTAKY